LIRRETWLLAWLLLAVVACVAWPATAIDETRYLAVAWEMHAPGAWLVPQLNHAWYGHKPPLMFWLIDAGWDLFGVSVAWARLVPLASSLLTMALVARLATRLWPHAEGVGRLAALLTGGTLLWVLWSAAIMFDLPLTTCVVTGALALHYAGSGGRSGHAGWAAFGVALSLGGLTKGPVVLLHLLPLALAGPWWSGTARAAPGRWYAGLALAIALGVALALAWVIPAAGAAGERFAVEILWHQLAGRAIHSFAHLSPWWSYLPTLLVILLPWTAWPDWWRQLRRGPTLAEPGSRFCVSWLLSLVLFCIVSAKQPHYLLPLVPAIALLAARGAATGSAMSYTTGRWLAVLPLALLGAVLAVGRLGPEGWHGGWLKDVHPGWGIAILAAAAWTAIPDRMTLASAILRVHVATVITVAMAVTALHGSEAGRSYDTRGAAREIASLQAGGTVTAYWGKYRGQLGYTGRLTARIPEIGDVGELRDLLAREPGARVLVESWRNPLVAAGVPPEAVFAYRRGFWSVWPAAQLAADPGILQLIRARPGLRE
jgi:4-amino-4-deoxy-L-arabinose transferase-like glycosyltransferase